MLSAHQLRPFLKLRRRVGAVSHLAGRQFKQYAAERRFQCFCCVIVLHLHPPFVPSLRGPHVANRRDEITDVLRGRVLRGLQAGALRSGDRLPSARDLVSEFAVDHRVILDAYRALVEEDLVELRPRGGIYVSAILQPDEAMPPMPESWFARLLTDGLAREIPAAELHQWLQRCTETLRLRSFVVATTVDQIFGLCRELRDDFGLESDGLLADEVRSASSTPQPVRRADLIVTTEAHEGWLGQLAADMRKRLIVLKVRPDLRVGEWAILLRRPVFALVATQDFAEMLREFFGEVPGAEENLRILVVGQDDVSQIPPDAPTYVTQSVREKLRGVRIPGRILPAARTIATESAYEIFTFIVRMNVEAMSRPRR